MLRKPLRGLDGFPLVPRYKPPQMQGGIHEKEFTSVVPDYATHYFLKDKEPFLNLSDLPEDKLKSVVNELDSCRTKGNGFNRVYGGRYMELRRKTEQKLRNLFILSGGNPKRKAPHYFVLGESYWFKNLTSGTNEVRIPLSSFPSDAISFTYPDSFVSMGFMPEFGLKVDKKDYHGKVFSLHDLESIIDKYGLPEDDFSHDYGNYVNEKFEKFIEIQVWDETPIQWLNDNGITI